MDILKSIWTYVVAIALLVIIVVTIYAVHSYNAAIAAASTARADLVREQADNTTLRTTNATWATKVNVQNTAIAQLQAANDDLKDKLSQAQLDAVVASRRSADQAKQTVATSVSPQCPAAMTWLGTQLRQAAVPW